MASIWAEVLQLEEVSTTESIFELGADSLAIFRIAARAQREGVVLKATEIFEHRTILNLCQSLFKKPADVSVPRVSTRVSAAPRSSYKLVR
jgi:acyl carrier protein